MKNRRTFLASLAGLFALPFVSKAEAKPRYKIAIDPPGASGEPDHYSHHSVWQEWPNDGSPPIRHKTDPGKIKGSFVVKMDFMDFKTNVK